MSIFSRHADGLFGVEADWSRTALDGDTVFTVDKTNDVKWGVGSSLDWLATVRGRGMGQDASPRRRPIVPPRPHIHQSVNGRACQPCCSVVAAYVGQ